MGRYATKQVAIIAYWRAERAAPAGADRWSVRCRTCRSAPLKGDDVDA
jgi:hypothetical protein